MNKTFAVALLANTHILQAVADNKAIEWRNRLEDKWYPTLGNYLTEANLTSQIIEFRVKPEPVVREHYGTIRNTDTSFPLLGGWYSDKDTLLGMIEDGVLEKVTSHVVKITSTDGKLAAEFIPFDQFKKEHSAN